MAPNTGSPMIYPTKPVRSTNVSSTRIPAAPRARGFQIWINWSMISIFLMVLCLNILIISWFLLWGTVFVRRAVKVNLAEPGRGGYCYGAGWDAGHITIFGSGFTSWLWRNSCFIAFSLSILSFSFFSSFLSSLIFSIQLNSTKRWAWTCAVILLSRKVYLET